ncbi:hypothetical protein BDV10DRAFT_158895 [Aspergillus recurvatus]
MTQSSTTYCLIPQEIAGSLVAFLVVDLENRRRVKLHGKITAGSLNFTEEDESTRAGIALLTVHVDGSLGAYCAPFIMVFPGNCPKILECEVHCLRAT